MGIKKVNEACIGDFVFEDQDADGIQDTEDKGINGVTVKLLDSSGNVVNTTVTANIDLDGDGKKDGNGGYIFYTKPGDYKVMFNNPDPNKYMFSPFQVGTNPKIDSDGPVSDVIHVVDGEFNHTIDAGLFHKAKVGDFVFNDADQDGIQDAGESGIAGATVNLQGADGNPVATTTTDANGMYMFSDLNPGDYKVTFVQPNGFDGVSPFQAGGVGVDSDANPNNGLMSNVFTLTSGDFNDTIDAGFFKKKPPKKAKLGDFVFNDADQDGIQDAGESGIAGATVNLQGADGNPVATTTTDANGMYMFSDLNPGDYKVTFVQPNGFDGVSPFQAGGAGVDSDANPNNGLMSDVVTLTSGEFNDTIDAGFFKKKPPKKAKLGDFVFNDADQDGIQDAGESGIAGAIVNLQGADGNPLATTTTDANGMYMFSDLNPGDYKVTFVQPNGFDGVSPFRTGGDTAVDSDANPNNGLMSDVVTLTSGEFNDTIDAGFFKSPPPPEKAKLGDFVFNDADQDGIQDAGESGIAGAIVNLQGADGNPLATTTTDANGMYMFSDLNPGDYKVTFVQPNGFDGISPFQAGGDAGVDSDANPDNGLMSDVVTLTSGEFNDTIDAGFFVSAKPAIDIEKLVRVVNQGPGGTPGQDTCDTTGKPGTLRLQYIPGTEFNTQQSSKKGEGLVNNGIDSDGTSFVVISEDENGEGDVFFSGEVDVNEIFEVSESKFPSNTFFSIFDEQGGPLLQSARYHTSCSAPIVLGDEIYSLTLIGVEGEDGSVFLPTETDFADADTAPGPDAIVGSTVDFQYLVNNTGDTALGNVEVTDDRLSGLTFDGGDANNNDLLDLDETWTYSASETAQEGLQTNKGTVTAMANGIEVMDMDPANYTGIKQPAPSGDICETLGKPRALTFEYNPGTDVVTGQDSKKASASGTPDDDNEAYIVVSEDDKVEDVLDGEGTIFADSVEVGEEFTASAEKFKSNTSIFIFDDFNAFQQGASPLQSIEYHTSCSQPIRIGDIIGSVELTGYVGEEGSFASSIV